MSEKMSQNKKKNSDEEGVVNIGDIGNISGSTINISGKNATNDNRRTIDTGGGAYVQGNVNVGGGDFVGRDKYVNNYNNISSIDEIAKAFAVIIEQANQEKDPAKRERAQRLVKKLETEARKGDDADPYDVEDGFAALISTSADTWNVAVAMLSRPIEGISKVFQKVAMRIKDNKAW